MTPIAQKALIPNASLRPFEALIGEWKTEGSHPQLPFRLHGRVSFQWLEGGAFMMMLSEVEEKGVPSGISIFGSDDAMKQFFMLYFDERNVSRKFDVAVEGNIIRWWRNEPGFAQRYSWTIADDGKTVVSRGELSRDGQTWERDLDQTFTRV